MVSSCSEKNIALLAATNRRRSKNKPVYISIVVAGLSKEALVGLHGIAV
jgi:hypothetical protein